MVVASQLENGCFTSFQSRNSGQTNPFQLGYCFAADTPLIAILSLLISTTPHLVESTSRSNRSTSSLLAQNAPSPAILFFTRPSWFLPLPATSAFLFPTSHLSLFGPHSSYAERYFSPSLNKFLAAARRRATPRFPSKGVSPAEFLHTKSTTYTVTLFSFNRPKGRNHQVLQQRYVIPSGKVKVSELTGRPL